MASEWYTEKKSRERERGSSKAHNSNIVVATATAPFAHTHTQMRFIRRQRLTAGRYTLWFSRSGSTEAAAADLTRLDRSAVLVQCWFWVFVVFVHVMPCIYIFDSEISTQQSFILLLCFSVVCALDIGARCISFQLPCCFWLECIEHFFFSAVLTKQTVASSTILFLFFSFLFASSAPANVCWCWSLRFTLTGWRTWTIIKWSTLNPIFALLHSIRTLQECRMVSVWGTGQPNYFAKCLRLILPHRAHLASILMIWTENTYMNEMENVDKAQKNFGGERNK